MKIAHLTTVDLSLRFLILPQLMAMIESGHEVIGISAAGDYVQDLERAGIEHVALSDSTRGMNLRADWRAAVQLWRYLRSESVDVLHTHNPKPGVYGRIVGRLAGVPIVVNTVHGLYATEDDPVPKRLIVYALEALASRCSDAELIQNPEDLDLLRRYRIVPRRKLGLLGNGIDLSRFNPAVAEAERGRVRDELGVEDGQIVVGMVGRLVAEKGYREFFEAAELVNSEQFVFVAVGPEDQSKADALDPHLLANAADGGVRFLGMRTDVDRLYGGFDLFALPSYREGFPRAAMEAAASGLAVIATDIRGCRQVVEHGVTGLLVPVRDPQALAGAVASLGSDAELRAQMGQAAVARAASAFDERKVVEKVLETYRQSAHRRGMSWMLATDGAVHVRSAIVEDARAIANLHRSQISTDFLSSLGEGFLRALYEFLIIERDSAVFVSEVDGSVVGFIAALTNTGYLWRRFALRRGVLNPLAVLPRLARRSTVGHFLEEVRYGSEAGPDAVILLSVAVAPSLRGKGVSRALSEKVRAWALQLGKSAVKAVVAADHEAAIGALQKLGFGSARSLEVHKGQRALEFRWCA